MRQKRTVFLVDDDPAVRHALGTFLESTNFNVRAFASAEALLDEIDETAQGVLVLDQRMGGMSGLELQEELKAQQIDLPIIFITGHGDVQMSVTAMKAGARDFIEKPFSNEDLLASIRETLRQYEASTRERSRRAAALKKYEKLTPREQEVMAYIVQGVSNKNLAERLSVSNRTIEVHRSRVMTKMDAESLPDLVRIAAMCGIDSTPG